jgi:hypothetical protein
VTAQMPRWRLVGISIAGHWDGEFYDYFANMPTAIDPVDS